MPLRAAAWEFRYRLQSISQSINLSPGSMVAAVAAIAAICLGLSQFLDYRAVAIGTPEYEAGYDLVAPAPQTERATAGSAHLYLLLGAAVLALVLIRLSLAGRPEMGWWVAAVGIAGVVVSLAIDLPKGLDAGTAGVAYLGTDSELIEGFWVQLVSSATLVATGVMLARYMGAERSAGSRRGSGARRRPLRSSSARART
jgi:hypothetical protein